MGPYLLAGHCFGGIIAYEMAQQLAACGESVARLILMDVPAPIPEHRPPSLSWSDAEWLGYFIGVLEDSTGVKADFKKDEVAALRFEKQLTICRHYMESAGVIPIDSDIQQVKGLIDVFKTNSQMAYRPKLDMVLPITLLRASEPHPAYDYSAADDADDIARSSLEWRTAADTTLEIKCIPGHHISMLSEPNAGKLAQAINTTLATHSQFNRSEEDLGKPDCCINP